MNTKSIGIVLGVVVIALLVIVLVNSRNSTETRVVNDRTVTTTTTEETHEKSDQDGVKTDINIKTDVTTTVNCGNESCFKEKFAVCQPATATVDTNFGSAYYQIIGPANGGCKTTFKYTKNPNQDWVNKEMTCNLDNKISFEDAFKNAFSGVIDGTVTCSGPLYTLLRSM